MGNSIKISDPNIDYVGECSGNLAHGKGVYKTPEYKYEGNFINGKIHGNGKKIYEKISNMQNDKLFESGIFHDNKLVDGICIKRYEIKTGTFIDEKLVNGNITYTTSSINNSNKLFQCSENSKLEEDTEIQKINFHEESGYYYINFRKKEGIFSNEKLIKGEIKYFNEGKIYLIVRGNFGKSESLLEGVIENLETKITKTGKFKNGDLNGEGFMEYKNHEKYNYIKGYFENGLLINGECSYKNKTKEFFLNGKMIYCEK